MNLPKGFLGSAVAAGLRKKPGLDVALLVAPAGASAAAVFTKNRFQAAPVVLSRAALKKSRGRVKAVVVNAGCANAVTGAEGLAAARRVQESAADLAGCPREEVFVASTGVIGVVLPDERVTTFLPDAFARLSAGGIEAVSRAILTTDAHAVFDRLGLGAHLTPQRSNGLRSMVERIKVDARAALQDA